VLRLSTSSIERDIRDGVICKAEQLHRNVEDYKTGVLLPDNPRPSSQRLFPIIVSPRDWPRIWILKNVWPAVQAKDSMLSTVEPLELLDADEVETLQPMLRGGMLFAELLDRKNRPPSSSSSARVQSMHDYLILTEPGILPADTDTRLRGGKIAADLMNMVKQWSI
jgi:hypothetical protein